ncbi:MAG: phospho-sugar mutase [Candidatus Methylacidiphilales bacterium]
MSELSQRLDPAVQRGDLLPSTRDNILFLLEEAGCAPYERASVEELIDAEDWTELNDRFYQTLKFGTGGLRGRTIAKRITRAEQGDAPGTPPAHPAAGTNVMNGFNLTRATQGLINYLKKTFPGEAVRVVISHDTRYFSRAFAERLADIVQQRGGTAYLVREERSTPELSFAVRHFKAHAGVMLTASHNPPHDNGFKAYFADGGQVVEPHASGIIDEVMAVRTAAVEPDSSPGEIITVAADLDEAYLNALAGLVLEPEIIREQARNLKIVFTPIHGTGIRSVPAVLDRFGFQYEVVEDQAHPDGGFPTVKSPNPENSEALAMALDLAKEIEADFLAGTDPDADRMGVIVRDASGHYQLLTGNQIGSILAAYRLERLFNQGVLNAENASRAALIKTFVTTDLQKAIASSYGVKCIETLTGFKYIGEKLHDYEQAAGGRPEGMEATAWRDRLLEQSTYFVFGGEESYGYSAADAVRDKDANAAVLMFAEAAAWCKANETTLPEYLDALYLKHGYYFEKLGTLTFEGAEGAQKIQRLLAGYIDHPPETWCGRKVAQIQNFETDEVYDSDGKRIPKEKLLIFHLDGGSRVAVRGSGTEPKIKYYFFARADVADATTLPTVKAEVGAFLEELWNWTRLDAEKKAQ